MNSQMELLIHNNDEVYLSKNILLEWFSCNQFRKRCG
jgi:hypothetical protein